MFQVRKWKKNPPGNSSKRCLSWNGDDNLMSLNISVLFTVWELKDKPGEESKTKQWSINGHSLELAHSKCGNEVGEISGISKKRKRSLCGMVQ